MCCVYVLCVYVAYVYMCMCVCVCVYCDYVVWSVPKQTFPPPPLPPYTQLLQAKLVEKLGSAQFDSPRPRYHATRALVYLGQVDMVKMSLFEPNSFDVDSVLWSDESSSVRYAR